mmetsp:Transcript_17677/g.66765  ORF Transcript_17677/g.66765 Transcript_17677/m.66765 type:complete len:246 (+) Transcript_17677:711-1448(+)
MRAVTLNGIVSCRPTRRTRKDLEMLAAMNAAPKATASSPLRCTPRAGTGTASSPSATLAVGSGVTGRSARRMAVARASCTAGTRTPPPMISTTSTSSGSTPAARQAWRAGPGTRAMRSFARRSKSSRCTVVRKSMSPLPSTWAMDSTLRGNSALALRTCFTLDTALRSLAMARGMVRTSLPTTSPCFALNTSAACSTSTRSRLSPPSVSSQPLPMTTEVPCSLPSRPLNEPKRKSVACVPVAPML